MLQVNFSPFPSIETNRLLLRKPFIDGAADLFELRSNMEVMKYVNRPIAKTINDAEELINRLLQILGNNEGINWFISTKENPSKVIGNIGIWQLKKEDYRGEIGYMLHPNYWRKGIIQEAIEATITYAFKEANFHSLEAKIHPLNIASAKVLEKTGFIKEAHFKEDHFWNGQFEDTIVYSLLNKKSLA
jgi:[ribosomal protein S5]-alanine N-acetyltransferase